MGYRNDGFELRQRLVKGGVLRFGDVGRRIFEYGVHQEERWHPIQWG